ncbi:MAG: hypothetical protein IJ593_03075 [Lachnospiraceae bacterium]|nr:hypothetical protein [Lachnospiraceae bacterium]
MIVVEKLINTLRPLVDNKIYRQGTFSENKEYPKLFITFWENESNDKSHYDNVITHGIRHLFDVNVYGSYDEEVYDTLDLIITALKNNGFIVDGKGIDVPSDEPNFIGRHIDVIYLDYGKEN